MDVNQAIRYVVRRGGDVISMCLLCDSVDVVHHNLCEECFDEMMEERHADYVAAQQERCK